MLLTPPALRAASRPVCGRIPVLCLCALLAGCVPPAAPPEVSDTAQAAAGSAQAPLPPRSQAYFATEPRRLFEAARAVCTGPGRRPVVPSRGVLRCEELPDPELAAALILRYGGTVADVPVNVVSFTSQRRGTGYVVTAEAFVEIPQPDGTRRILRLPDPETSALLASILVAGGGQPL